MTDRALPSQSARAAPAASGESAVGAASRIPRVKDLAAPTPRSRKPALVIALVGCLSCAFLAGRAGLHSASATQLAIASQGLVSFSSALSSLLERHESLPRIVAIDPRVADVLARADAPASRAAANAYLEAIAQRGGLLAAFVIDRSGLTLASSNWNTPQTFVGRNYGFRPYFRDALAGDVGRFYAIGNTTSEPGYFIAAPVHGGGQVQGVVVVKVDLQRLQDASPAQAESVAVADAFGVIFLASDASLRYRPIAPLSAAASAALTANQAYPGQPLQPLQPTAPAQTIPAELRLGDARSGRDVRTVVQTLSPLGWRVISFVDTSPTYRAAAAAAFGGGSAAALLVALLAFADLRRQRAAEAQRSRDDLFRSRQRLHAVADNLPVMVCFLDRDERYVFANAAFAQHLGHTGASLEGSSMSDIIPADELAVVAPYLARAWRGETVVFEREYRDLRGFRYFEATYRPEWNAQQTQVIGLHVMTQDVTATRRRLDELARSAQLDHLTQLLNRKGFDVRLAQAVESPDEGQWVALLFIDLDDFKPVNDQHGHPAGDALLQGFGKRLAGLVRASDAVARLGGDEFAVILPGIAAAGIALRLAATINRMAATPFALERENGLTVRISASIGVAVAAPGIDADALCRRADDALYEAKKLGKGRYCVDADAPDLSE